LGGVDSLNIALAATVLALPLSVQAVSNKMLYRLDLIDPINFGVKRLMPSRMRCLMRGAGRDSRREEMRWSMFWSQLGGHCRGGWY